MRIVFKQSAVRHFFQWMQGALFASAVLLLGYCAFVLWDGWRFQHQERRHLEQMVLARQVAPDESPRVSPFAAGMIGRIDIPRLGISVMVMEGTTNATLRHAAGHIAGTPLPGQPGNVGISAHRDTFFRPLRNVRKDDVITVNTAMGEYRYRVETTRIVTPEEITVLDPSDGEVLTLVTCYPFYFVGPAPKRFIVRASRII